MVERRTLILASGLAALLVAGVADTMPRVWPRYVNARYRYQLCYPSILKPQAEAPNGDGRTFHAIDGAILTVFGRNDVLNTGIDTVTAQMATDLAGPGGRTTYRAGRDDWRVISGRDRAGGLFYAKTLRRQDQYAIFQLTYPRAAASRYGMIAARLGGCFAMIR